MADDWSGDDEQRNPFHEFINYELDFGEAGGLDGDDDVPDIESEVFRAAWARFVQRAYQEAENLAVDSDSEWWARQLWAEHQVGVDALAHWFVPVLQRRLDGRLSDAEWDVVVRFIASATLYLDQIRPALFDSGDLPAFLREIGADDEEDEDDAIASAEPGPAPAGAPHGWPERIDEWLQRPVLGRRTGFEVFGWSVMTLLALLLMLRLATNDGYLSDMDRDLATLQARIAQQETMIAELRATAMAARAGGP